MTFKWFKFYIKTITRLTFFELYPASFHVVTFPRHSRSLFQLLMNSSIPIPPLRFSTVFSNPHEHFKFDFANVRGLRENFLSVFCHMEFTKPHVLALSETQVTNLCDESDFHMAGYTFLSNFFPHRGTCMYVKQDLNFVRLPKFELRNTADFNVMWLRINLQSHIIYLCFVYRSPNLSNERTLSEFELLSDSVDEIIRLSPNAEIVFAGDFNVHNVPWLHFSNRTDPAGLCVESFAVLNDLSQLVSEPTRIPDADNQSPHLLDLFLTTDPDKYSVSVNAPLGKSDHCLVSTYFPFNVLSPGQEKIPKRNVWHYKNAMWKELNDFYLNVNWVFCFHKKSVDEATFLMTFVILMGMNLFIPQSSKKVKKTPQSWFTPDCKVAIANKNVAYFAYKSNRSAENRAIYVKARNLCNAKLKSAKFHYEQKIKNKLLNTYRDARSFWSFAKDVSNNFIKSSTPPLIDCDGDPIIDSKSKANVFVKIFAKNSTLEVTNQRPPVIPPVRCRMKRIHFRTRVISRVLRSLNANKSSGPDGVTPTVLKNCDSSLSQPLARLFHLSYSSGVYPTNWKLTNVQPVFKKKGNRSDPRDYRPIAITSILAKVMEKVIKQNLMIYLETNDLIHDRQYGFRSKRSTGDIMAYLSQQWSQSLHSFGETQAIALDFSKAFDRVWHENLLSKLSAFGVGPEMYRWIESFLTNRSIQVVLDGSTSDRLMINAGVPQGSVLSPILFLIYINDLLSTTSNPIHGFADDSTLHHSYKFDKVPKKEEVSKARKDMVDTLSSDLTSIKEWVRANRVELNLSKTQKCRFSHKKSAIATSVSSITDELEETANLRVLGTNVTCKLLWSEHIMSVTKNAAKRLGFLRRCKKFFSPPELAILYKAYIRPLVEFDSHLWVGAPPSTLNLVERLQKKAFRLIGDTNITDRIDTLEHRRIVGAVTLFYRYFYGDCSSEISGLIPPLHNSTRVTRLSAQAHPYTVASEFCRTVKFRGTFFSAAIRLWNRLPAHVFPPVYDPQLFKKNIHVHYRASPPIL